MSIRWTQTVPMVPKGIVDLGLSEPYQFLLVLFISWAYLFSFPISKCTKIYSYSLVIQLNSWKVASTTFVGFHIRSKFELGRSSWSRLKEKYSWCLCLKTDCTVCRKKTLKTIYFSLIHSNMSYEIAFYGATSKQIWTE